jgi:HEAT repeat protein
MGRLGAETASPADGNRLPAFVMQTFLRMGLKRDDELLAFARRTAGDASWSDPVRGQALLLIAKLGAKDDLDGLYAYLESPSPSLRARALQAIATLQSRLSTSGPNG